MGRGGVAKLRGVAMLGIGVDKLGRGVGKRQR